MLQKLSENCQTIWSIYLHLQQYLVISFKEMINFDDVTGENKKNLIQIGCKFLTIHTEW